LRHVLALLRRLLGLLVHFLVRNHRMYTGVEEPLLLLLRHLIIGLEVLRHVRRRIVQPLVSLHPRRQPFFSSLYRPLCPLIASSSSLDALRLSSQCCASSSLSPSLSTSVPAIFARAMSARVRGEGSPLAPLLPAARSSRRSPSSWPSSSSPSPSSSSASPAQSSPMPKRCRRFPCP